MTAAIDAFTQEEQSSADWLFPSLAFCPTGAPILLEGTTNIHRRNLPFGVVFRASHPWKCEQRHGQTCLSFQSS